MDHTLNTRFTEDDYLQNPEGLRIFVRNHAKTIIKKMTTQINFM
jgi:hypothetical protein